MHENVIVRRAAAKTLKLVGDSNAIPCLIKALTNDQDTVVQFSAAGAIAIFGKSAIKPLLKVLSNPKSTAIQCGLVSWCITFIGAKAPEEIKEATQSENVLIRSSAIAALEDLIELLGDKEAICILAKALNDSSHNVQLEAIRLIGKLKEAEWGNTILINKLNNPNTKIRQQSILALMKSNKRHVLDALESRESKEKDLEVREILNLVLNRIRDRC